LKTPSQTDVGAYEPIDRVGEPDVFAHLDTFQMNVEEKGFWEPAVRLGERLRYVHLSESDRGTPGNGNVRRDELFGALSEIGFDDRLVHWSPSPRSFPAGRHAIGGRAPVGSDSARGVLWG
jgi:sugar phosphate isomerase/epimerase